MLIRKRQLPLAWYPETREGVEAFISSVPLPSRASSCAVMVPHAAWMYSGAPALEALATIPASCSLLVLMGGHLAPGDPILVSMVDAFDSPAGMVPVADTVRDALLEALGPKAGGAPPEGLCRLPQADPAGDNSLEVLFPFFPVLFPRASALALRVPPSVDACRLGQVLAVLLADKLAAGEAAIIASTDLTHYGPSYGLEKDMSSLEARAWVREINDRPFIDAVFHGDAEGVLAAASRDRSACSAGAVAALITALEECSAGGSGMRCAPRLVARTDSLERGYASSFVSYAAVSWQA